MTTPRITPPAPRTARTGTAARFTLLQRMTLIFAAGLIVSLICAAVAASLGGGRHHRTAPSTFAGAVPADAPH